jgi:hypothetical protein
MPIAAFALPLTAASALLSMDPPGAAAPPATPPAQGAPAKAPEGPEAGVSKDRILDTIKALPTKRSSWGDEAHSKGLRETEKILFDRLSAMGYKPTLDLVDFIGHRVKDSEDAKEEPYNNIIVDIPGIEGPAKEQWLILSAHMDAVPAAPGADDDGSGVAVLLEAAKLLKDRPMQRSVRLILFNLEENGLVGSRAYTQRIRPDVESGKLKIAGMISMDMLGYYSDKEGSQKSPIKSVGAFEAPTVGDFVGMAGILRFRPFSQALDREMKVAEPRLKTVVVDFLPIAPLDLLRSDHAPFIGIGVPAVILADTADFRNPNYHKAGDTIDTLDLDRLTIAARGIVGGLYRLAGPPGTPLIDLTPLGMPPPAKDKPADDKPADEKPSAPDQPAKSPG